MTVLDDLMDPITQYPGKSSFSSRARFTAYPNARYLTFLLLSKRYGDKTGSLLLALVGYAEPSHRAHLVRLCGVGMAGLERSAKLLGFAYCLFPYAHKDALSTARR